MSKTILSQEQENDIVYKYEVLGISKNKLHIEYGVSEGTIKRVLIRNGVHVRTVQETNVTKYKINHNFFNKDTLTSEGAYIIGLIASDGCVNKVDNCVYIELQQKDKELLNQVNLVLENQRPIKDYERINKQKTSKLYFFSRQIKQDLAYYDVIPNKTYLQVNFSKNIPDNLFFDFLRGFFDGDGSITWAKGIRWQLDGSSLLTFETIKEKIKKLIGIDVKIVETTDYTCSIPRYRLYTYSQNNCRKIFEQMYKKENCIKLHRKYERFLELLK